MNTLKCHPLISFVGLAFGISWLIASVMIARYHGLVASLGWWHYLAAWGPGLAAIIITAVTTGATGFKDLAKQVLRWRLRVTDYFLAISPLLMLLCGLAVSYVVSGVVPDLAALGHVDYLGEVGIVGALIVWTLSFGLGEELGWRGFAQGKLEHRHSFLRSAVILGIIWALWYLPYFFYRDTFIAMGLRMFPFYLLNIIPGAILLAWLYKRTQSILAVSVWHGLFDFGTAAALDEGNVATTMSVIVVVWALWIAYRIRRTQPQHITS
jgi:membrane protease YdiL (CAAX protease family)